MPQLTFCSDRLPAPVVCHVVSGTPRIDVVRDLGLPLYWRCGHGTCGACRVYLTHAAQPCTADWCRKERHVQHRQGLITAAEVPLDTIDDSPTRLRLACALVVGEVDWMVRF